jgi:hypothetical protein
LHTRRDSDDAASAGEQLLDRRVGGGIKGVVGFRHLETSFVY